MASREDRENKPEAMTTLGDERLLYDLCTHRTRRERKKEKKKKKKKRRKREKEVAIA